MIPGIADPLEIPGRDNFLPLVEDIDPVGQRFQPIHKIGNGFPVVNVLSAKADLVQKGMPSDGDKKKSLGFIEFHDPPPAGVTKKWGPSRTAYHQSLPAARTQGHGLAEVEIEMFFQFLSLGCVAPVLAAASLVIKSAPAPGTQESMDPATASAYPHVLEELQVFKEECFWRPAFVVPGIHPLP